MEYYISDGPIPIVLIKNFLIPSQEDKNTVLKSVFKSKKNHEKLNLYKKQYYSYPIENDSSGYLKKLYGGFLSSCFKIFGHFDVAKESKSTCWAYCSNKNDFNSYWHDHNRVTINSVYYINIPDNSGGPLFFRTTKDNNEYEIFSYYPKNYDLVIFPNYLEHKPIPPSSSEYRISINMEIICKNISSQDIFKKVHF